MWGEWGAKLCQMLRFVGPSLPKTVDLDKEPPFFHGGNLTWFSDLKGNDLSFDLSMGVCLVSTLVRFLPPYFVIVTLDVDILLTTDRLARQMIQLVQDINMPITSSTCTRPLKPPYSTNPMERLYSDDHPHVTRPEKLQHHPTQPFI